MGRLESFLFLIIIASLSPFTLHLEDRNSVTPMLVLLKRVFDIGQLIIPLTLLLCASL